MEQIERDILQTEQVLLPWMEMYEIPGRPPLTVRDFARYTRADRVFAAEYKSAQA